jgi:hypothetical protein
MTNFWEIPSFNASLKDRIDNIVLFLYFPKTTNLADFKGLCSVSVNIKKNHIKNKDSQTTEITEFNLDDNRNNEMN